MSQDFESVSWGNGARGYRFGWFRCFRRGMCVLASGPLLFAATALAQDEIAEDPARSGGQETARPSEVEEILVTGTTEGVSDMDTSSVTAFDSETLAALGVQDIEDISDYTPNLEIVTAGTSSATLFIRGVGLNDFSPISTASIAVYEDDVPRNAAAIVLGRIYDAESIAVYRGPQGTGAFRNASAGAIKIVPRKPSGGLGGKLSISYGNYDYVDIDGAFETPIVEDLLAVRVAFGFSQRDGWMYNRCGNAPPFSERVPIQFPIVDDSWNMCGETSVRLNPGDTSPVPPGLPDWINAKKGFAARSIFSFTPDLPFESEWFLNLHGEQRRDDSGLGQSIGAGPLFKRVPNEDPQPPLSPGAYNVPAGTGGPDPNRYRDADIESRSQAIFNALLAECASPCRTADRRKIASERNRLLAKSLERLDDNPFAGAFNHVGATNNDVFGASVRGTILAGESLEFETITGFENWDRLFDLDLDMSPNTAFELATKDKGLQLSQEIRLSGEWLGLGYPIAWSSGGLALYEDLDVTSAINSFVESQRTSSIYSQEMLSLSAYLQAEIELSESFSVMAGARYNRERKSLNFRLVRQGCELDTSFCVSDETKVWEAPTGLIQLNYRPTEDITFFAKYTRGWKAGTFNATSNPRKGLFAADPETIDAYEIGADLTFMNGMLYLAANLFIYDYQNYQIFISDNNYGSLPELVTINAGNTAIYGAELEVSVSPFEGGQYEVRFGWLESQFIDFAQQQFTQTGVAGVGDLSVQDIDYSGNRLLNSPEFTVSILASQDLDLGRFGILTVRYNGAWTDDVFFDASEGTGVVDADGLDVLSPFTIGQKAYWLHGAGLEWTPYDGGPRVAGWVRNLTDQQYKTFSLDASSFQQTTIHFVGLPRTYGATLSFEW